MEQNFYRILITGANGQLGSELQGLIGKNENYLFATRKDLDICNKKQLESYISSNKIGLIINCAGYTNVDKAEEDFNTAKNINVTGVNTISNIAHKNNIFLIHISTDYVFDGSSKIPYKESDSTNPISLYGKTKRDGELEVIKSKANSIIIRTAWLYSKNYGKNFLKTMIRLGKEREEINVVNDQFGTPTNAKDLANCILHMIKQIDSTNSWNKYKGEIYNYTNEGSCTWYEFAKTIMETHHIDCKVHPITTEEYPTTAKRPANSILSKEKIKREFGITISQWKESLQDPS